jgi:hypothetical protein
MGSAGAVGESSYGGPLADRVADGPGMRLSFRGAP